jgi:ParB family chromosome partitioning protein
MKYELAALHVISAQTNVRKSISSQAIAELAASLKQHGQHVAIICYREGEWLVIVDGHSRFEAAKQLGWEKIRVCILDAKPDLAELKLAQLTVNCRRQDLNPCDLFDAYTELMQLKGLTPSQLATALGVPPAKVTNVLSLGKLTSEQRELVRANKVPLTTAYAASRLPEAERDACFQKVVSGELTRDQVQAQVRRPKAKTDQAKSKRVSCQLAQGTVTVATAEGLNLSSLIDLLDDLLRRCRKARSQGWDILTAVRVLRDSARAADSETTS